jgi:dolichol-phosphate mannosyltransferase
LNPEISVVVPVKNEADNIRPLIEEIVRALKGRERFEIVYVDDGSTDDTPTLLKTLRAQVPELRAVRHAKNSGQSAAIHTGVTAARGALVVTLDGDGQNDPADIPALIERFRAESARNPRLGLVAGQRLKRRDSLSRRLQSRIANQVRRALLNDGTQDTGCSLKVFARETFLKLPYFDHMHRFLPALVKREGLDIAFVTVGHRPRRAGRSHYGLWGRLGNALTDLAGVVWLMRRRRSPGDVAEL